MADKLLRKKAERMLTMARGDTFEERVGMMASDKFLKEAPAMYTTGHALWTAYIRGIDGQFAALLRALTGEPLTAFLLEAVEFQMEFRASEHDVSMWVLEQRDRLLPPEAEIDLADIPDVDIPDVEDEADEPEPTAEQHWRFLVKAGGAVVAMSNDREEIVEVLRSDTYNRMVAIEIVEDGASFGKTTWLALRSGNPTAAETALYEQPLVTEDAPARPKGISRSANGHGPQTDVKPDPVVVSATTKADPLVSRLEALDARIENAERMMELIRRKLGLD